MVGGGGELLEDRGILALGGLEGGGNGGGTTHTATAVSEDTAIGGRNEVKKSPNLCWCRHLAIGDRQFRMVHSQGGQLLGIVGAEVGNAAGTHVDHQRHVAIGELAVLVRRCLTADQQPVADHPQVGDVGPVVVVHPRVLAGPPCGDTNEADDHVDGEKQTQPAAHDHTERLQRRGDPLHDIDRPTRRYRRVLALRHADTMPRPGEPVIERAIR